MQSPSAVPVERWGLGRVQRLTFRPSRMSTAGGPRCIRCPEAVLESDPTAGCVRVPPVVTWSKCRVSCVSRTNRSFDRQVAAKHGDAVHFLFNNAGISVMGEFETMSKEVPLQIESERIECQSHVRPMLSSIRHHWSIASRAGFFCAPSEYRT